MQTAINFDLSGWTFSTITKPCGCCRFLVATHTDGRRVEGCVTPDRHDPGVLAADLIPGMPGYFTASGERLDYSVSLGVSVGDLGREREE